MIKYTIDDINRDTNVVRISIAGAPHTIFNAPVSDEKDLIVFLNRYCATYMASVPKTGKTRLVNKEFKTTDKGEFVKSNKLRNTLIALNTAGVFGLVVTLFT